MKYRRRTALICVLSFAFATSCFSQGTFRNLDFEAARYVPGPYGYYATAADALPNWSCYLGTNQTGIAWYNLATLDDAAVGVMTNSSHDVPPSGFIQGQVCLSLQWGYVYLGGGVGYWGPAAIAQAGQIPADAKSIRFLGTSPFSIAFAGNAVPLAVLNALPNYSLYGGDISQFAGQTGELRITSYLHFNYLDSIQFSNQPIPEPSTLCLVIVGLAVFCRRLRRFKPCDRGRIGRQDTKNSSGCSCRDRYDVSAPTR